MERVRERFVEEGLESALARKEQKKRRAPKVDGEAEAYLVATACSKPPAGRQRWTLRLLADRLVELEFVDTISLETVRQSLKKTASSRGGKRCGVWPGNRAGNLSARWRMFFRSISGPMIPGVPNSAWMR